ncbi:probable inactive leucine-rich repeat receptor-like protein kinase At3g03770 [Phoenix dactylifera]|uniref:Probable inactive leucine-rich repeat receptor-like protein kinase At3g03770 n=1 Tax=Phoenix dactylifera TaxID=42345 RepID=A0A8B8ZFB5_PHODC|nr:probable inactive leucine-rich repeat receptor-like protein kinase At3g03770 [Phoenix dactylifera]XP_038970550.1 probable inactive leucine-rich repeat receptor-like protein kinase At3g03770 [Phoenix dactylifera]
MGHRESSSIPLSPAILSLVLVLLIPCTRSQLQSSQAWSLLRIQRLLNYPPALSSWNTTTDLCYAEPNPSVTVVCYEDSITQLHIAGNDSFLALPLPRSFSIDSLFTTLTRLPNLKVLSLTSLGLWGPLPPKIARLSYLEIVNLSSNFLYGAIPERISDLRNLQTLILDRNLFGGRIPDSLGALSLLAVLSARNNSLSGPLPDSLATLESLRVLALSSNSLSGQVPDLRGLANLQVLDLERNFLGPQFPQVARKVVTLVLRENRFTGGLPADAISSCYLLRQLDISSNRFVGPFPPSLLSLPSLRYLNVAGNRFTGKLFSNTSCNDELEFIDLSSNLLSGNLPTCLVSNSTHRVVKFSANCLAAQDRTQHPPSVCQNEALAVGILPRKQSKASASKALVVTGIVVGVVGGALLLGFLIFFALRRASLKRALKTPPRRLIEHASSGYPSKLLADARYISQAMKLGALGIPSYRSFSLEELVAATNNFETSSFMGEGSHGQMYRGRLNDGSLVAIRCLKLKKSHTSQNFSRHIELISKLRHRHLVSALGHCFEYYLDDSTISRLFLVFEYISNGTLRSNISEGVAEKKLTWTQRISAAIGVAKGIQFLHADIIPGLFANDLKITKVLLDQNLVAKISSYNLPVLAENMKAEVLTGGSSNGSKELNEWAKHADKIDIYDFGVILLEVVCGRPITSQSEVEIIRDQLQASVAADGAGRSIVDPVISRACCDESLKTVVEICLRCLSKEPSQRPSVEDVLWNLQFAAQVQDAWRGDSQSSEDSPLSPHPPSSPLTVN